MSFARSAITPLSTRQERPATPQTSCVLPGTAGSVLVIHEPGINSSGSRKIIGSSWIFPLHAHGAPMGQPLRLMVRMVPVTGGPCKKRKAALILARRSRRLPSELRQDRVRHGLQGVYVVHLQPLQHYSLHTGLKETS